MKSQNTQPEDRARIRTRSQCGRDTGLIGLGIDEDAKGSNGENEQRSGADGRCKQRRGNSKKDLKRNARDEEYSQK